MARKRLNIKQLNKEWLQKQYCNLMHSAQYIADELCVHRNTVMDRLIEFNINRRSTTEHFKSRPKTKKLKVLKSKIKHRIRADENKKVDKTLLTKHIDLSNYIAVKVDRKTTIYVRHGTDIEKIKQKYAKAS